MEQSAPIKHDLAIIYLKSCSYDHVQQTKQMDRSVIRKWIRDNSTVDNYDLLITSILDRSKPYKEVMDGILEEVKDHKYYILITNLGCHATKYIHDKLLESVESPTCVTLLAVTDYVILRQALMRELPPMTISHNAIRRCMTSNQLETLMDGCAKIKTQPNGIVELSYVSVMNVEIERRPESLDEKFNTIMQGGLSNLVPYWDLTPIYIDPVPVKANPEVDQSLESMGESEN